VGTANNTIGVLPNSVFTRANRDSKQQQSAAAPAKASNVSAAFAVSIDDLVSGENVIAFNCEDGVRVTGDSDISNRISQNSIYANKLLGINLVSGSDDANGVTPNDSCDTDDPGPNHLQNFPELLTADVATQTITGTLNSTFNGSYVIEFFLNPPGSCDSPSNHGEGKRFIGSVSTDQITDESCDVPFTFDQALCNFNAGDIITATATDVDGNTSEFSVCFTVPSTTGPVVNVTLASPSSGAVAEDGPTNLVYRFSRTPTTGPLVANFSVTGTADSSSDYTIVSNPAVTFDGANGTINFADGQDHVDVIVDPTADNHPEDDETVKFTVTSGTGYDPGTHASAKGTIKNDDNCPYILVVNDAGDASDTAPGDGTCDNGLGKCTLRAAIEEANALPACAPLEIDFNIAGAGVQTITPATPLPAIIQPVTIAGYTQPGAQANTDPNSDNAIIQIELNGANAGANANGLVLDPGSDQTFIEGLAINRFNGAGIVINSNANEISGNFIGTDALGTSAGVNRAYGNGVGVLVYGVVNEVGCTFSDMRNVISGNHQQGVSVMGGLFNFVQGNFIGTDKTGTSLIGLDNEPMGNGGAGVEICGDAGPAFVGAFSGGVVEERAASGAKSSSTANLTSDQQTGMADRVSARRSEIARRISLKHSATANGLSTQRRAMVNNMTRRSSVAKSSLAARNSSKNSSIALEDSGGDISGSNIIAGNGGEGVLVTSDDNLDIIISQNSIYSNGGLGINLVDNFHAEPPHTVTPNDAGDVDDGPNNLQNFPVITSVDAATQTIQGTLHSQVNNPDGYLIEFFVSPSCDPSGYGEGKKFIGDLITDATDANGDVSFTFNPPPATPFAAGDVITATATDIDGNTSEFSPCSVFLSVSKSQPSPALFISQDSTYMITVTNSGTTPVTTATVKEAIPAGMDLTSATGTNWICLPAGPASDPVGAVTCNFSGSLAASGTSSIAIVVRPKPAIGGQSVTNNYSIDSTGGTNPPDPTTCTAANVPAVGCGLPVVSTVGAPVCPTIVVDPAALANGIQNVPYSQTVTASGGSGSYSFLVTGGALPDGLSLSSGGLLDGTPTAPGTFNFTITATDSGTCTGSRGYTISICPSQFSVKSNGDLGDANPGDGMCATSGGVCTLRAAIEEANALAACGTINIDFIIGPATITLNGGQLTINHDVNINGPAGNPVTVTGNNTSRVFTVNSGKTASISNLTISGGKEAADDGGAIRNNGTLTLKAVTLSGNAAINGGAIRSDGGLVLINTTISGNLATGDGGGLYNANNQATLTNVTVAYNRANSDSNVSGTGGGISIAGGNVLLHNTIVTDNYNGGSPSTTADDIGGLVDSSSSYDLVGNASGGLTNGVNHNQTGVATALLGALMNNGGPTATHGLLYNSPALEAGDDSVLNSPLFLNVDQRGLTRPADGDLTAGAHVDIGAYERESTETRPAPGGPNSSVDINDVRLTFPSADSEGQNGVELTVVAVPNDAPAGSGPAFDVHPTSNFYTPPVTMCFYLPSITNPATFTALKVFHREGAALVEHTATGDFASKTVCVNDINSFSIFVLSQPTINPTAANGNVGGQVLDSNGKGLDGAAVRLSGTQDRLTITDAEGNYHFDNVETNGFYVVTPSRANFSFSPAQRSFSQLGAHTDAVFTGTPTSTVVNPLDATEYFVRQQYLDFLGREPDESGFNFWVNNIESCGTDSACREVKRIDTSAAFFLSIEFQQTGYLVYRAYEAAYGDSDSVPVPLTLRDFTPDTRNISKGVVVLQTDWPQKLEANKQAFMTEFVQRQRFTSAYPTSMTPAQFVDKLFATAHVESTDPDYAATVAMFGAAVDTSDVAARARVLRRLADNSSLTRRNFNRAFVLMEYFGYLGRDPNSGPDPDFGGYNSWLTKLNQLGGDFVQAEMVKAFLASSEYRRRFGP
jgi:uncharacterized repeat protein (TIGR01451 family)/CSLREA domain-containing protein